MKIQFGILFAFLTLLGTFADAQPAIKDEASLKLVVKQLTDAQVAYDAKALDKLLAPDYVEISPLGEFDTRDKVLGFYSPEAKAAAAGVSVSVNAADLLIRSYGSFAIVIARLNYAMSAGGKPLPPRSIRATYFMRKHGKTWQIASAQYTGIRPPPPPNS